MQALRPLGASLDAAAIRFAESMQRNTGDYVNNVTAPAQRTGDSVKPKLVSEVLKELLRANEEKGRSQLYLIDLRVRLTRFAGTIARPLCEVTAVDVDDFLRSLEVSPRSQNNFRATIGTLFRFGQSRGYVPREHPCVSNVEKASQTTPEIQVFTPEEMEKIVAMVV